VPTGDINPRPHLSVASDFGDHAAGSSPTHFKTGEITVVTPVNMTGEVLLILTEVSGPREIGHASVNLTSISQPSWVIERLPPGSYMVRAESDFKQIAAVSWVVDP
jgi:hypothetical protein